MIPDTLIKEYQSRFKFHFGIELSNEQTEEHFRSFSEIIRLLDQSWRSQPIYIWFEQVYITNEHQFIISQ